jgi:hypothetical protein
VNFVALTDSSGASRVFARGAHSFVSWDGQVVVDDAGRSWQVAEDALVHDGARLERLSAHRAFWFGWHAAFPQTRLVR